MLRVEDVAEPPPPRRDQVPVQVVASSVNGTDLGIRSEGAVLALPRTPGLVGLGTHPQLLDLAGGLLLTQRMAHLIARAATLAGVSRPLAATRAW